MKILGSKPNGINLEAINPKKHGEKFSPNLYAWLKNHRSCGLFATLWKEPKTKTLWIGWFDDTGLFIGREAYQAMAGRECLAFPNLILTEVRGFWKKYLEVGRCAIDPDHTTCFSSAGGERWNTNARSRTCRWCGRKERKTTHKVVVTKTKWEKVPERDAKKKAA